MILYRVKFSPDDDDKDYNYNKNLLTKKIPFLSHITNSY